MKHIRRRMIVRPRRSRPVRRRQAGRGRRRPSGVVGPTSDTVLCYNVPSYTVPAHNVCRKRSTKPRKPRKSKRLSKHFPFQ